MERFVLRYRGSGASDRGVERLANLPGVRIVERAGCTLLVEATETAARALEAGLPDWSIGKEYTISLPRPGLSVQGVEDAPPA
jgi:hypothetical protein